MVNLSYEISCQFYGIILIYPGSTTVVSNMNLLVCIIFPYPFCTFKSQLLTLFLKCIGFCASSSTKKSLLYAKYFIPDANMQWSIKESNIIGNVGKNYASMLLEAEVTDGLQKQWITWLEPETLWLELCVCIFQLCWVLVKF